MAKAPLSHAWLGVAARTCCPPASSPACTAGSLLRWRCRHLVAAAHLALNSQRAHQHRPEAVQRIMVGSGGASQPRAFSLTRTHLPVVRSTPKPARHQRHCWWSAPHATQRFEEHREQRPCLLTPYPGPQSVQAPVRPLHSLHCGSRSEQKWHLPSRPAKSPSGSPPAAAASPRQAAHTRGLMGQDAQ